MDSEKVWLPLMLSVIVFCLAEGVLRAESDSSAVVVGPGEGETVSIGGDKAILKAGGAETDGQFAFMEYVVMPGGGPPVHLHHHEQEAFYILEGEFEFTLEEKALKAVPGTFIKSAKDVHHTLKNVGTTPGKILILVTPAGLEDFFRKVGHKLERVADPALPMTPEDAEKMNAAAPDYGLEIMPPPAEPSKS